MIYTQEFPTDRLDFILLFFYKYTIFFTITNGRLLIDINNVFFKKNIGYCNNEKYKH